MAVRRRFLGRSPVDPVKSPPRAFGFEISPAVMAPRIPFHRSDYVNAEEPLIDSIKILQAEQAKEATSDITQESSKRRKIAAPVHYHASSGPQGKSSDEGRRGSVFVHHGSGLKIRIIPPRDKMRDLGLPVSNNQLLQKPVTSSTQPQLKPVEAAAAAGLERKRGSEFAFMVNPSRSLPKEACDSLKPKPIEEKIKRLTRTLENKALVSVLPDQGARVHEQLLELHSQLQAIRESQRRRRTVESDALGGLQKSKIGTI